MGSSQILNIQVYLIFSFVICRFILFECCVIFIRNLLVVLNDILLIL